VAAFNPSAAREVLRLSKDEEPVAFTPLGYPADELKPKKRKALSSFVRYF
jgi:nitroreductase